MAEYLCLVEEPWMGRSLSETLILVKKAFSGSGGLLRGRCGLYLAFSDSNEAMSMEKRYFTSDFSSRS